MGQKTLIMAAAVAALSLQACGGTTDKSAAPAQSKVPAAPNGDLTAQAEAIRSGGTTSAALVEAYLARIAALDDRGPELNAVLALNPDALEEARALDAEAAAGTYRGPLHGVPILLKDNIESLELPTTAGAAALRANDTGRDTPFVARLRAAGAIILGKTNLSEWANFRSNESISGWSSVGGQTRNAFDLTRSPCGSSSGSGVAMAAQLAAGAIGTETNGSIMCPSAMNGVVGFKPTVGLVSRSHVVPISPTQDTAGPMTRSVRDAALMVSVMAGSDPTDPWTAEADGNLMPFAEGLRDDLNGLRIGVFADAVGDDPDMIATFDEALSTLESLGAVLVEVSRPSMPNGYWDESFLVLKAEFKDTLNAYLSEAAPEVEARSLGAVIAATDADAARSQALFDQDILIESLETVGMDSEAYITARANTFRAVREEGLDKLLTENDLDALVAPSRPPTYPIDPVHGDSYPGGVGADYLAAVAGYPNLTVPMGDVHGLPVGISFMGGKWTDGDILSIGHAYEQASMKIMVPTFAASSTELPGIAAAQAPIDRQAQ